MEIFNRNDIANFLTYYNVPCTAVAVDIAPQVVTYHFEMSNLSKFKNIQSAVKMMSMEIRQDVEETKSSKAHFALRIRRQDRTIIDTTQQDYVLKKEKPYSIMFGVDEENGNAVNTLQALPHLLVAGTTGSGKSVALDSFITQLATYNRPDTLGMVLIDLKQCEFNVFRKLPHLVKPIINDCNEAEDVLKDLVEEMENRYKCMAELGIDNAHGVFKPLLVVVDELADLVLQNPNCKDLLVRLLQKARASDIHIIVATQSPRAKILDGLLLANLPSRIALTCASVRESMLILGHGGAEKLTGKGDAILQLNGDIGEKRVQVPFITKKQIEIILGGKQK